MNNENLLRVRAICQHRFDQLTDSRPMLDFQEHEGQYVQYRFNNFSRQYRNVVTKRGEHVMSACDLWVRQSLEIAKLMGLPDNVEKTLASFFHVPRGVDVPCHLDEEKHEGFTRNNGLLTFNVSAPASKLYVNRTGLSTDHAMSVTGYFSTILNPTQIFHGVLGDPDEDLFLVQFSMKAL